MRASQFHISTSKETPADAEIVSHQLMLRAGLIRRLASGLYTWMPMGLRVIRKIEAIVREEMRSHHRYRQARAAQLSPNANEFLSNSNQVSR